jgi:hypothetical protein
MEGMRQAPRRDCHLLLVFPSSKIQLFPKAAWELALLSPACPQVSTKRKAIPTIGKKNNKSSKSISCLPRPLLWGPLTLAGVAAVVAGVLMAREIEPLTSQEVEKTREMSTLLGDERFLFRPADAAPAPERSLPR